MKKNKFPIRLKVIILISIFALVLSGVSMIFFAQVLSSTNDSHYKDDARNISNTISEVIDDEAFLRVKNKIVSILDNTETLVTSDDWGSPEWEAYQAQFTAIESDTDYIALQTTLRKMTVANEDISSLYLVFIYPRTSNVNGVNTTDYYFIYAADGAEEDPCPPGCVDVLYDINFNVIDHPEQGFRPYITNTESYGWLCTAGSAIYHNEEVIGFAMSDISMALVKTQETNAILNMLLYLAISIVVITLLGIIIVNFTLVVPIKKMTTALSNYGNKNNDEEEVFTNLKINTHDELEELAFSMGEMEKEINHRMKELRTVNEELVASQQVADKMTELANKDALTGIRNKISYDSHIANIKKKLDKGDNIEFGIVMVDLNDLKVINDKYGHSNGDVALIKLSTLVCGVFAHSPVFRIGGDEFVVIVQNIDYKRVDILVNEFKEKIKGLQDDEYLAPQEKISAAIGYALYDKNIDKDIESLFTRADEEMYACKRHMKHRQD